MSENNSSTGGYLSPTSLSPDDDDVLDGIMHDMVVGITGLDPTLVRPRWQPQMPTMPPFDTNWAAVGITNTDPIVLWPEQRHYGGFPNSPGYSVQKEHQLMDVMVTFYGPNAGRYAGLFVAGLTIRQNLEVLGTFGIKLKRVGNITRAPEIINTQWVQRHDVSFPLVREIDRTYAIEDVIQSTVTVIPENSIPTTVVVNPP